MSSEVEICNLALAHLGDSATVASINPPEGSAQAEHCQRWYPIARDSLLEMQEWNFATTRAVLAEVVNPFSTWQHAYARPADCLKVLEVGGMGIWNSPLATPLPVGYLQGFSTETDALGNQIIVSNFAGATIRYTRLVTDTSKFSPLFRDALGWYLASYLAGPVLKGETGIGIGQAMLKIAVSLASTAAVSSANQQARQQHHAFPWSR